MIAYNSKVLTGQSGKWLSYEDPNPLNLPPFTMRILFEDLTYNPTNAPSGSWKTGATWTRVSSDPNVWDYCRTTNNPEDWSDEFKATKDGQLGDSRFHVLGANTTGVTDMSAMFYNTGICSTVLFDTSAVTDMSAMFSSTGTIFERGTPFITSIPRFDTHNVTDMSYMFYYSDLTSLPLLDTGNVTSMKGMFQGITAFNNPGIASIPDLDTSKVTDMSYMFNQSGLEIVPDLDYSHATDMSSIFSFSLITYCPDLYTPSVTNLSAAFEHTPLTNVPDLTTDNATDVRWMFNVCPLVESGALDLYTKMSSQTTPPSLHNSCFAACGSSTTTGAAELAQIPNSWGGTAP